MGKKPLVCGAIAFAMMVCVVTNVYAVWNFNYPGNNATFNKNTGDGTGNATANTNIQYRLMKTVSPDQVNKLKNGTSASTGGWYLVLPTPLTTGANQTAQLLDRDNGDMLMTSSTNITVTN